ncbi:hypothetical protein G6F57_017119 [Rhizopus arrhizus]|nr:hypothetical protein G6F57_017119 [Rhizopus arrhizus]
MKNINTSWRRALLGAMMISVALISGCASTQSAMLSKDGGTVDPRLTESSDAKFFSKSGYQACAASALGGVLACTLSNSGNKAVCAVAAGIAACGVAMGANYYLDYRRSQYANTTDRLNAITGDIRQDTDKVIARSNTVREVIKDDQARLENIKMDMKMARADEAQAKKELSSVDLNIAKMREELDKMRDKVDQYREVAEKERAANGGMPNKQLDSEITKMNQRVASLQSEVDGLTVSLAIAMATLAGCATTAADCDPSNSDVSILTKMSCDGSGQYRGHIDRAEQDLISAQEANARFRQIHADIEAQRQAVGQSLAAQRAQQLALNKSLGAL